MSDIKMQLGARIKELRKAKNITQEQLVEFIGSDTNNLSQIENGKKFMSADKLVKILFPSLARTLKSRIIAVKKTSFEVLNFVGAGDGIRTHAYRNHNPRS